MWLFLFFISLAQAQNFNTETLRLELGESVALKKLVSTSVTKIWVEKKDILSIEKTNTGYFLKALDLGFSHLRINQKLFLLFVHPLGSFAGMNNWQIALKPYPHLAVDYCGVFICIEGELKSFAEYLELMRYSEKFQQSVYFTAGVNSDIQNKLRQHISKKLRLEGYTPQQLIFSKTWRMYYGTQSNFSHLKKTLADLGVELYIKAQLAELSDNVEVNVKIVELSKNFYRKYGMQWPSQFNAEILSSGKLKMADSFEISLNTAESNGEAKILASPRLITRNEKEASFFAGGEFPMRVSGHKQSRIEWRKFGISLKLKPKLDSLGQLSLQLETEISSVNAALRVDDVPAVQVNKVSSHFDTISGKTIALSGLIRHESSQSQEGLAFLSQIPLIGALFSSRNFIENKSELVIFVTPKLLSTELSTVEEGL
jgi:pilus assembly protein CpaC